METSLYFKTLLILSIQLGIIFVGCFYFLKKAKESYIQGVPFLGLEFIGKKNSRGELDLIPINPDPINEDEKNDSSLITSDTSNTEKEEEPTKQQALMAKIFLVWMLSMFGMIIFARINTAMGLSLMTITSISFSPLLGVIMLEMDENDGLRAILLTCFITVAAAIVGMYSGIDFSFMRSFLFFGLCALILIGLVRLFFGMTTAMIRAKAIAGAMLFSLYLVYDFNRLKQIGDLGVNDWSTALQIAISIYLDILNLLLEILDAMGNS